MEADESLRGRSKRGHAARERPWVIEPWIAAPPQIVVYEYGARLEPLDLRAASRATDAASGAWSDFSRHARAGRAVVALHEFDRAIRWACARHATAVFDLTGLTTRTCAACGSVDVIVTSGLTAQLQCLHCGGQHDRHANAAACAWSHAHADLEHPLAGYRKLAVRHAGDVQSAADNRKAAVADRRRGGRTAPGKA